MLKKPQNFKVTSLLYLQKKNSTNLNIVLVGTTKKEVIFSYIISCETLQVQNVVTLMLFLISYQQITRSPYRDTYIRVRIILLWVSIPGVNEAA